MVEGGEALRVLEAPAWEDGGAQPPWEDVAAAAYAVHVGVTAGNTPWDAVISGVAGGPAWRRAVSTAAGAGVTTSDGAERSTPPTIDGAVARACRALVVCIGSAARAAVRAGQVERGGDGLAVLCAAVDALPPSLAAVACRVAAAVVLEAARVPSGGGWGDAVIAAALDAATTCAVNVVAEEDGTDAPGAGCALLHAVLRAAGVRRVAAVCAAQPATGCRWLFRLISAACLPGSRLVAALGAPLPGTTPPLCLVAHLAAVAECAPVAAPHTPTGAAAVALSNALATLPTLLARAASTDVPDALVALWLLRCLVGAAGAAATAPLALLCPALHAALSASGPPPGGMPPHWWPTLTTWASDASPDATGGALVDVAALVAATVAGARLPVLRCAAQGAWRTVALTLLRAAAPALAHAGTAAAPALVAYLVHLPLSCWARSAAPHDLQLMSADAAAAAVAATSTSAPAESVPRVRAAAVHCIAALLADVLQLPAAAAALDACLTPLLAALQWIAVREPRAAAPINPATDGNVVWLQLGRELPATLAAHALRLPPGALSTLLSICRARTTGTPADSLPVGSVSTFASAPPSIASDPPASGMKRSRRDALLGTGEGSETLVPALLSPVQPAPAHAAVTVVPVAAVGLESSASAASVADDTLLPHSQLDSQLPPAAAPTPAPPPHPHPLERLLALMQSGADAATVHAFLDTLPPESHALCLTALQHARRGTATAPSANP